MSILAWLGGAAFVVSLSLLVYFYGVTLATPGAAATGSAAPALLNAGLFSAFALHHSLFARSGAKRWLAERLPAHGERVLYVWTSSLGLIAVCLAWQPLPGIVYHLDSGWRVAGYGLQLGGLWLTLRAAAVMDPLALAGIRPFRPRPDDAGIRAAGPFSLVRHPIYLGWMLLVGATPLMTAGRLLFAVVSTTYLILAIPWEERSLVEAHGDQYREYQRAVRWRLVPGVW